MVDRGAAAAEDVESEVGQVTAAPVAQVVVNDSWGWHSVSERSINALLFKSRSRENKSNLLTRESRESNRRLRYVKNGVNIHHESVKSHQSNGYSSMSSVVYELIAQQPNIISQYRRVLRRESSDAH